MQLHEATGLPAVNFGLHAGLKLDYLMHTVDAEIDAGDLVILVLEYSQYLDNGEPSHILTEYVSRYDPTYFEQLPTLKKLKFLLYFEPTDYYRRFREPYAPTRSMNLRRDVVNNFGDILENVSGNGEIPGPRMRFEYRIVEPYSAVPQRVTDRLASWVERWTLRGARVLRIFPPTVDNPAYKTPAYANMFNEIDHRMDAIGVGTLGNAHDFMGPAEWFHNTEYHANDVGRTRFTDKLIQLLREQNLPNFTVSQ